MVASAILNEHPDLKALPAGNDSMVLDTISAIRAVGHVGQVKVVDYDSARAIRPVLKGGRMLATADQFAARQAMSGTQTTSKLLAGQAPEHKKDGVVEVPVELMTVP